MGLMQRFKKEPKVVDPNEKPRPKRTPFQWRQLIFFYFMFYSTLTCIFAICYVVMFDALPPRHEGPVLRELVQPGLTMFPRDYTVRDDNRLKTLQRAVRGAETYYRTHLTAENKAYLESTFPQCASFAAFNASMQADVPCFIGSLNRNFGFVPKNRTTGEDSTQIVPRLVLDFPSEEEFLEKYKRNFQDLVTTSAPITNLTNLFPYRGERGFTSAVAAGTVDLTGIIADFRSGVITENRFTAIIGLSFDWGQKDPLSQNTGFNKVRITYNNFD